MSKWLYDSHGTGVAFVFGSNVFTAVGKFVGKLDGNEIWNSVYVGEIIAGDRIAHRCVSSPGLRGVPASPGLPGLPGLPSLRSVLLYPATHEDLDLTKV
jgi:hypothetical protein